MKRRKVYICYDSDLVVKEGVQRAERKLMDALSKLSMDVRAVRIPPAADGDKQGADDFLKAHSKAAFAKLVREAKPVGKSGEEGGVPVFTYLTDVKSKNPEFLWYPRVPLGMLTSLEGHSKQGKTFVALSIAAEGSRGREPNSTKKLKGGAFNTVYMSHENHAEFITRPRFIAMDGDPARFAMLEKVRTDDGKERGVTLKDISVIEACVNDTKAKLLIIDPLQSYIGSGVDLIKPNETRPIFDGLMDLAERLNIAVIIIRHLTKGGNGARAEHRAHGGTDIGAAMRSQLMAGSPDKDKNNRALVHANSTVAPTAEALAYTIEQVTVEGADTAHLIWQGKSDLKAEDLVATEEQSKPKGQVDLGAEYLERALADGPRLLSELEEESGLDRRRLGAARKRLFIKASRDGKSGPWRWELYKPKFAGPGVKRGYSAGPP